MGADFSSASSFPRRARSEISAFVLSVSECAYKIQPDFFTSPAESEKYFYTRKIRLIDVLRSGTVLGDAASMSVCSLTI